MKSRPQQSIRRRMLPLLVACGLLAATTPMWAQSDAKVGVKVPARTGTAPLLDVPKIAYTKFVLRNGLTVVVHEDHSSPIAAVELDFHVGTRDEPVGKRGFAHLFEHMMFEAGPHDQSRIIQEAGGNTNAATWEGRTQYFDQAPTNMLETVLWLEAERLAFLPARLDSVHFERARAAVLNEYAQKVTNVPAGRNAAGLFGYLGSEVFLTGLFPDPNPYHVSPFGVMSELSAASIQDVRGFFDKYYTPNNATLVIAGDVKVADARKMVEKYFNGIPRNADIPHPKVPQTPLARETRFVLEDRIANTLQLWVGWRAAPTASPDRVPLTALSAILSGGTTSLLYKALVDDRKMTVFLPGGGSGYFDLESAGIFQLNVGASGNASLTDIEHVVDSVITAVRDNGVQPQQLRRWVASYSVSAITGLQRVSQKAARLAEDQVFLHDPGALSRDLVVARQLTPADIQRVARKYLIPGRLVMSIVPAGKLNLASKPTEAYVNVTRP